MRSSEVWSGQSPGKALQVHAKRHQVIRLFILSDCHWIISNVVGFFFFFFFVSLHACQKIQPVGRRTVVVDAFHLINLSNCHWFRNEPELLTVCIHSQQFEKRGKTTCRHGIEFTSGLFSCAVLGQRRNDVAQRRQRLVDRRAFLQTISRCASTFRSLTAKNHQMTLLRFCSLHSRPEAGTLAAWRQKSTSQITHARAWPKLSFFHRRNQKQIDNWPSCQINQVNNGGFGHFLSRFVFLFLNELNADDGVSAGRRGVHVGGRDSSVSRPFVHFGIYGFVTVHGCLRESFGCLERVQMLVLSAHCSQLWGGCTAPTSHFEWQRNHPRKKNQHLIEKSFNVFGHVCVVLCEMGCPVFFFALYLQPLFSVLIWHFGKQN